MEDGKALHRRALLKKPNRKIRQFANLTISQPGNQTTGKLGNLATQQKSLKTAIDPGDEAGSIYRAEMRICLMLVAAL